MPVNSLLNDSENVSAVLRKHFVKTFLWYNIASDSLRGHNTYTFATALVIPYTLRLRSIGIPVHGGVINYLQRIGKQTSDQGWHMLWIMEKADLGAQKRCSGQRTNQTENNYYRLIKKNCTFALLAHLSDHNDRHLSAIQSRFIRTETWYQLRYFSQLCSSCIRNVGYVFVRMHCYEFVNIMKLSSLVVMVC